MARNPISIEKPKTWSKRIVFRLAGKFTSVTGGYHESLAKVHGDAMRRIAGSWASWDHPCTERPIINDLEKHLEKALEFWNDCVTEDAELRSTMDTRAVVIETDASMRGYGFLLRDGEYIVYSEARLFAKAAEPWHANRREFYALSQAVIKMDTFLRFFTNLNSIVALTDSRVTVAHADEFRNISSKALERKILLRMKNHIAELAFLWRQQGIKFLIKHIAGISNSRADKLSRTCILDREVRFVDIMERYTTLSALPEYKSWLKAKYLFRSWRERKPVSFELEESTRILKSFFLTQQEIDEDCARWKKRILEDPLNEKGPQGERRFLHLDGDGLLIRIFRDKRQVYIPERLTVAILSHMHCQMGHAKLSNVLHAFFDSSYNPKARKICLKVINQCKDCLLADPKRSGQMHYGPVKMPEKPFQVIGMDLYGPLLRAKGSGKRKRYILTIVDRLTGYTKFHLLDDARAETVVSEFEIFCWSVGAQIKTVVTDNGPQFVLSALLKGLCLLRGITHVTLPLYSPWAGGFYEIRHRIATRCLRALLIQFPIGDWRILTAVAQSKVNSHVGNDRTASPHQLIYGWSYVHPAIGTLLNAVGSGTDPTAWTDPFEDPEEEAKERSKQRDEFLRLWEEEFQRRQVIQEQAFGQGNKEALAIGDYVMVSHEGIKRKFAPLSKGPMRLIEQLGRHTWLVKGEENTLPMKVHTRSMTKIMGSLIEGEVRDEETTTIEEPVVDNMQDIHEQHDTHENTEKEKKRNRPGDKEQQFMSNIGGSHSLRGRLRRGSMIEK
jgi:hypothetical protein